MVRLFSAVLFLCLHFSNTNAHQFCKWGVFRHIESEQWKGNRGLYGVPQLALAIHIGSALGKAAPHAISTCNLLRKEHHLQIEA